MIIKKDNDIKRKYELIKIIDSEKDIDKKKLFEDELKHLKLKIESDTKKFLNEEENKMEKVKKSVVEKPVVEKPVVEKPVVEKPVVEKTFIPRAGSKKEKAWELFKKNIPLKDIVEQTKIKETTARTWYAVYKKHN